MRLIKISVLAGVSLSLFACGGGGSSGGGSNGDGGNTNVLGAQWTNQIGSASGVSGTDNISLEPVSNTIYRLNHVLFRLQPIQLRHGIAHLCQ